jgi:hypothetical protein
MSIYIPYTYLIGWSERNLYYYGVRYKPGCNPQDFWVSYFTSSKKVAEIRKLHGEPDIIQIRKTFQNKEKAIFWEQKVLHRMKVVKKSAWINANAAGAFKINEEILKKRGEKISKTLRSKKLTPWNKGKTGFDWGTKGRVRSEETKIKMKKPKKNSSNMGIYERTEKTRKKLSDKWSGCKWYNNGINEKLLKNPPGENWVLGRIKFCKPSSQ